MKKLMTLLAILYFNASTMAYASSEETKSAHADKLTMSKLIKAGILTCLVSAAGTANALQPPVQVCPGSFSLEPHETTKATTYECASGFGGACNHHIDQHGNLVCPQDGGQKTAMILRGIYAAQHRLASELKAEAARNEMCINEEYVFMV